MSGEKPTREPRWDVRLRGYNRPGPVPRDEMWTVIAGALEPQGTRQPDPAPMGPGEVRRFPRRGWIRPAMAAAAILVVGIGLGRLSGPGPLVDSGGVSNGPGASGGDAVRVPEFPTLAADYLLDAEAFLTLLRADAREGQLEGDMGAWARSLLLQTRLLMETGQAPDPAVRRLLEDLELILVEVARIPVNDRRRASEELKWIDEGMASQDVLPRLRAVAPVGAGMAGT